MSGACVQAGPNDNATWLFIQPSPCFHNSEPWWSALFSMLVLHLAHHGNDYRIPISRCIGAPNERFLETGAHLDCNDIKFDELLVDAKLSQRLFSEIDWPDKFRDIRPDILIHQPRIKRVVLIENKTVGAELGDQLDRYHELEACLTEHGWSAEFLLLISLGYEIRREWRAIENSETRLILWEDILKVMDSIEFFRSVFDVPLRSYYEKLADLRA
ncbi:MAG: PD-(D/E)XK nuclease family protein [Candidatus Acidiferrales bacterium]